MIANVCSTPSLSRPAARMRCSSDGCGPTCQCPMACICGRSPTAINFRANIYGLKSLGVEWVIAVSAVGSMREAIHPSHLVIPDQFIDRTRQRVSTFFEDITVHVTFADPVCGVLAQALYQAPSDTGATAHFAGTYLRIGGPQFSTRAASRL